jgi:hypothetical protein
MKPKNNIGNYENHQSANNLIELIDLLTQIDQEEKARKNRLKDEPYGFLVTGSKYICLLCQYWNDEGVWYDRYGMKCLKCQDALNKKIVPGYIFRDYDNKKHVTSSKLTYLYNIHHQTLKKLVRQGKLTAREMPHGPLVFLKQENPDIQSIIEAEQAS